MKRMKFSLVIVFILIMMALLAANLPPAVVAQPPPPPRLYLECSDKPSPIKLGTVTNFEAWCSGGVPPYSWSWTVNGTEEASFGNLTYTIFAYAFNEIGLHEVCVTVTDSAEPQNEEQCCRNITVVGPSLTIVKTGPGTVNAGDTLNYNITVTNNGTDSATGVTIVDDYDEAVLIITDDDGGTDDGDTITWNGGLIISVGGSLSYNITATVSPTASGGYIIYNYANVTCAEGVSDSTSIATTVASVPPPPLYLECPTVPITINVCNGNVIDFIAWVSGGVPPYDCYWTVNGAVEEQYNTYENTIYFNHAFSETGLYTVCVNVTDSAEPQNEEQCCRYVTVNPALSLDLSPATGTNPVGQTHMLTATVSECGIPKSDVNLTWGRTGVGNFSGTPGGITDGNGIAYAWITSSQPGTTTVTCTMTSNTSVHDTAYKYWTTVTPPSGGGGGGGCPPIKYLTVDWDGKNTTKRLRSNDELEEDLLGPSPDGSHSLLLEQGTHAPTVDGETYYLITIRELELEDIPPRPENTVAIVAFNITPTGAVFNKDIFLTLGFNQLPENALGETLNVAYYDGVIGVWVPLESTQGERNGMLTISAPLGHFTIFAVLVDVASPSPPAAHFKASGLNIVTSVEKIWKSITFVTKTGESVTITATITNDGGQRGTDTVELKLDGETVGTETVTLGAGQSQQVSFTVSELDYGQHEVKVIGESGEFTTSRIITWWLIIVIIVAIGLIIWGVVWWRRRRRKAHQAA
jgi:uncharacterized repeat protein (TIGR01451 family)